MQGYTLRCCSYKPYLEGRPRLVKQASDSPYPSKQISEPVDAPVAKRGKLNTFASLVFP